MEENAGSVMKRVAGEDNPGQLQDKTIVVIGTTLKLFYELAQLLMRMHCQILHAEKYSEADLKKKM